MADALGFALDGPLAHHEGELQTQQLVEGQTLAGFVLFRQGIGLVDLPKCSRTLLETKLSAPTVRQWVGEIAGALNASRIHGSKSHAGEAGLLRLRGTSGTMRPVRLPNKSTNGFVIWRRPRYSLDLAEEDRFGTDSLSCFAASVG